MSEKARNGVDARRLDAPGVEAPGIDALVDAERARLVAVLDGLDDAQWRASSLCAGWRVRDLVAHLLMPYELSVPRFAVKIAAAGFGFDRMADRWATGDPRSNRELVAALRATADRRFGIPGAPPEAPLSHLVIHAEDVYRPLGIARRTSAPTANLVLDQLTGPRARRSITPGLLDGLAWSTTDTGWSFRDGASGDGAPGDGAQVVGSASALITTIAGRPAALDELSGDGAVQVRARLLPASPR